MDENIYRTIRQESDPIFWSELFSHFRWIIDKHENISYYFLNRLENLAKILLTEAGFLLIFNAAIVTTQKYQDLPNFWKSIQIGLLAFTIICFLILVLLISIKRKTLNVDLPDVFHLHNIVNQIYESPQSKYWAMYETMINQNFRSNDWAKHHQNEADERFLQYNKYSIWAVVAQIPFAVNIIVTIFLIAF